MLNIENDPEISFSSYVRWKPRHRRNFSFNCNMWTHSLNNVHLPVQFLQKEARAGSAAVSSLSYVIRESFSTFKIIQARFITVWIWLNLKHNN